MTEQDAEPTEYRLIWWEPAGSHPGLRPAQGETTRAWIGAADPRALQLYAAECGWSDERSVSVVRMRLRDLQPLGQVHCTVAALERWDPGSEPMPDEDAEAPAIRSPSAGRLLFLHRVRAAVDDAVDLSILSRDAANALLLAARDAIEEHDRWGGERPRRRSDD